MALYIRLAPGFVASFPPPFCLNSSKPIEKPGTSSRIVGENGQKKIAKEMPHKAYVSSLLGDFQVFYIKPQERKWQHAVMELATKTEHKSVNRSVTFS